MIEYSDEELTARWIKFQCDYNGKRFLHNGRIISKCAGFGLVERGEVKENNLVCVESEYHKKLITDSIR